MARSLEKNRQESGVNSETVSTLAFPLVDLPDLVLVNVANQLSNDDARNLSLTCMRFQGVLPIYKFPKIIQGPNINERGPNDGNFEPEKYFECPVLDHNVEKIDVSFKWKDQGYGNRKGQVWLQLRRPINPKRNRVDGECELIFEMESDKFGIAPHKFETADHTLTQSEDIVKLAKAGDYYQIMKNVGGGGGHRLEIEDFKITIHYKPYYEPREI